MEKRIYIDGNETNFWIEDTGRMRNERTKRWLKGGMNKGCHFYSIYFRGKQYIFYTHRLVAENFVPNPDNLPIVRHIDGDKTNNIYTNLQWTTLEESVKIANNKRKDKPKPIKAKSINIEDCGKIAQFRNSPYYATEDGRIINVSKKTEVKLEESGKYLRFTGNYNLNRKHFLVHRVVWEAFKGSIPEGYDVDHIDGNPKNNSIDNLQAISHLENIKKRDMDWSKIHENLHHGE
jgi:hypothetical protein